MKKAICLAVFLLAGLGTAHADGVWESTHTATNDGAYTFLCQKRAVLHGVCTNFGVAAASTTIVASSFTATAASILAGIPSISTLVADQCKYYDTVFVNGMGYQKTNVASVSILYQCY